jgi:predicted nucleic acid-binding Zn ribbon protein
VPEEADWQHRARLAADALAEAKADAKAKGHYPVPRGRGTAGAPGGTAAPDGNAEPSERVVVSGSDIPGQPVAPGQQGPRGRTGVPGTRRPRRGGRTRREDPQPLSTALDGLLGDQGWRTAAAIGSVFGRWDQLVGPDVAAHTRPERFNDGELVVIADSAAWATQVRLLTSTVLRRLNEELGHGTVTRVVVRGPAPPRRMGPLRVRGTREHNDDYG